MLKSRMKLLMYSMLLPQICYFFKGRCYSCWMNFFLCKHSGKNQRFKLFPMSVDALDYSSKYFASTAELMLATYASYAQHTFLLFVSCTTFYLKRWINLKKTFDSCCNHIQIIQTTYLRWHVNNPYHCLRIFFSFHVRSSARNKRFTNSADDKCCTRQTGIL